MNQLNKKQLDTFRGASGNLAKADSSSLRPLVSKESETKVEIINIDKKHCTDGQYFWFDAIPNIKIGDIVQLEKIHGISNGQHKSKLFQVIDIRKYANDTNIIFEFQSVKKDGSLGRIYEERCCKNIIGGK